MNQNKTWSDEDINKVVTSAVDAGAKEVLATDKIKSAERNFLVIGCGNGGCNMASEIYKAVPDTYAIVYNTSARALDGLSADLRVVAEGEDGSGKNREYSQNSFRQGSYKQLLAAVKKLADTATDLQYIMITTTTDGGTGGGVSPMLAKFLADNINLPVIIMGVYPMWCEDAQAQFNALHWQDEVEKTGLPYIVLDNNDRMMQPAASDRRDVKMAIHAKVNAQAATIVSILSGKPFGDTNISSVDNRDIYTLVSKVGGRLAIYDTTGKPPVGMTLDDYLKSVMPKWNEPAPIGAHGYALFIKGPKEFLSTTDTSLTAIHKEYGDALVQYTHIEESPDVRVSLIIAGCSEPSERLFEMRARYDDIQSQLTVKSSVASGIVGDMENPLGKSDDGPVIKDETDLSALGL